MTMDHHTTPVLRTGTQDTKGKLHIEPSPRAYRFFLASSKDSGHRPIVQSAAAFLLWEGESKSPRLAVPREDILFAKGAEGEYTGLVPAPKDAKTPSELASETYIIQVGSADGKDFLSSTSSASFSSACGWTYRGDTPLTAATPRDVPAPDRLVVLNVSAFGSVYEEDEKVLGGVKNPYHRVDIVTSRRHVQIYATRAPGDSTHKEDVLIADSKGKPVVALFETSYPTRWYLPPEAIVQPDSLLPRVGASAKEFREDGLRTVCPYKGVARYSTVHLASDGETEGGQLENIAWAYPEPIKALDLRGLVCFWAPGHDRLRLVVDGQTVGQSSK